MIGKRLVLHGYIVFASFVYVRPFRLFGSSSTYSSYLLADIKCLNFRIKGPLQPVTSLFPDVSCGGLQSILLLLVARRTSVARICIDIQS